jgi:hypothetical protein
VLSLQFPDDFTADEAERVARFVQTLPLKQAWRSCNLHGDSDRNGD